MVRRQSAQDAAQLSRVLIAELAEFINMDSLGLVKQEICNLSLCHNADACGFDGLLVSDYNKQREQVYELTP